MRGGVVTSPQQVSLLLLSTFKDTLDLLVRALLAAVNRLRVEAEEDSDAVACSACETCGGDTRLNARCARSAWMAWSGGCPAVPPDHAACSEPLHRHASNSVLRQDGARPAAEVPVGDLVLAEVQALLDAHLIHPHPAELIARAFYGTLTELSLTIRRPTTRPKPATGPPDSCTILSAAY